MFRSKKTSLILILLILGAILLAYIIPQRISTPPAEYAAWKGSPVLGSPLLNTLGLDHVYTTEWFSLLLVLFLISLTAATYDQVRRARGHAVPLPVTADTGTVRTQQSEADLTAALRKHGFRKTAAFPGLLRFVKHPWGYWGNAVLHLGIVLTIASSLVAVLTQKRGLLNLVEGELWLPGGRWTVEEKGILGGDFILPEAVRLDRVDPEFWETDDIKQIRTDFSFIDAQGLSSAYALTINEMVNHRGVQVYQSQKFGNAFFVLLSDRTGRSYRELLLLPSPAKRDAASYGNFSIQGSPYRLKAKYYADAGKQGMTGRNPLLVLRLVEGEDILGEASLLQGESGQFGPYSARLESVSRWNGLLFVKIAGMPGVFLGFFIIMLGAGLIYLTPPREIVARGTDGDFAIAGRVSRFEDIYRDEVDAVLAGLQQEKL